METKELKIQIPEGYEIDKENSSFEKIVFKKKDTKPRSWEEYLELNTEFDGVGIDWIRTTRLHHRGKAIVPTNLASPFIAMMQLMSLRQEWIGDWEPDWTRNISKFAITYSSNVLCVSCVFFKQRLLSFPTDEMAKEFLDCFKDLLEIAKPLI